MRIDSNTSIPANGRTHINDLMNRLDTGDVIRAKVIEIASDEAVLRLFDGSVLKAKTSEALDAKPGQSITLCVTSKSEGTVFLETVKNSAQIVNGNQDDLKRLLESLLIKPSTKNTELAAEFLKSGIPLTKASFENASMLMENERGMNADKAVYISSKQLNPDQVKLDLLVKLLNGDLKLGDQLKELQHLLGDTGKAVGNKPSDNNAKIQAFLGVADHELSSKGNPGAAGKSAEILSLNMKSNEAPADNTKNHTDHLSKQTVLTDQEGTPTTRNSKLNSETGANAGRPGDTTGKPGMPISANTAMSIGTAGQNGITAAENSKSPVHLSTPSEFSSGQTVLSSDEPTFSMLRSNNIKDEIIDENRMLPHTKALDPSVLLDKGQDDRTASSSASFTKLLDVIKELFIKTDSVNLASELDVNKMQKDLTDKLDLLKATLQSSGESGQSRGETIFSTATRIDDTVKLLNHLNSNNVLYFQLPVSVANYSTTAELYIMKRQKNKKKIDPHNIVLFIALDTNNLGRIETLLDVKGKNISINLKTEKQQINDFVKENIQHLYKALSECGYKLADVRYSIISSSATPLKQEQLLAKLASENHGKVDFRI